VLHVHQAVAKEECTQDTSHEVGITSIARTSNTTFTAKYVSVRILVAALTVGTYACISWCPCKQAGGLTQRVELEVAGADREMQHGGWLSNEQCVQHVQSLMH
jgi:hypothetical protein